MCFMFIWKQTAIISLYNINLSLFLTETECLLRGTDWVFKSDGYSFVLKGLMWGHVAESFLRIKQVFD